MQPRMTNPAMTVPGAMQAMQALGTAAKHSDVPETTLYLLELRASQINGCSVCVEMHSRDLKKAGEACGLIIAGFMSLDLLRVEA